MHRINDGQELAQLRQRLADGREAYAQKVIVSSGTCGEACGSLAIADAFRRGLAEHQLVDSVLLRVTGCHGFCEQEPLIVIEPGGLFYCRVAPDDVPEIIEKTLVKGEIVERLLYTDPLSSEKVRREADVPFYKAQDRALLGMHKLVDPRSIDDYIAAGGYSGLVNTYAGLSPEQTIAEIKASGLRGRGGGGFPTGRKWESCRKAPGDVKYVICNADEGDPGAYMDRSMLEGNPHLVLEGMIIGAYAIGAQQGYIYVRNEYPLALENAKMAVQQAREYGLLGDNILGSGMSFDVDIARGAGAFVAGESTSLMAALEGKVSEPRPKDVHTVEEGLWGRPTTLNNVETWANISGIINRGAAWFAAKGTRGSKGTKIFALTGRVKNTGLVEVAMGTSLRTIIYEVGGGASNGTAVKAVQTGGPPGGLLPVEKFDLPVDYDSLVEAGSMIGSGGIVVMDERTCMVDVAKYFLTFLQDESCGKCVPCRVGVARMLEIVKAITEGRGEPDHLDLLEQLSWTVSEASLCALGKTAANPVLSTMRYFKAEYEAHVLEKRCPAGVCRQLIRYSIDEELCTGCEACRRACPHGAIQGQTRQTHTIDQDACLRCGICYDECSFDAIRIL